MRQAAERRWCAHDRVEWDVRTPSPQVGNESTHTSGQSYLDSAANDLFDDFLLRLERRHRAPPGREIQRRTLGRGPRDEHMTIDGGRDLPHQRLVRVETPPLGARVVL